MTVRGIPFIVLWWLVLCWPVPGPASEPCDSTQRTVLSVIGSDLECVGMDAVSYLLAPASFSGRQWLYTTGVVGGTVGAMAVDDEVVPWVRRQASPFNDDLAAGAKLYGEKTYALAFSLSLYVGGLAAGSDDLRVTGRLLCESLLLAGVTTQAIKMLAGRSRPFRTEGQWYFDPLQNQDNSQLSLPSGHTAVAFALSSVLSERIGNTWASVGLYSLASLTALSRVYDHEHWLSDVLLGAAIGTGAGLAVTSFEEARSRETEREYAAAAELLIVPTVQGVAVIYRF